MIIILTNSKLIVFSYLIYYTFKLLRKQNKIRKYGDWGLGIGPNPQSPIPNPQFKISK
jgi:hypothetical protein